ncbi:MAG TPA: glycosyltransferase family 4 protein [Candidatus Eremiobacteraceae bacterium]|nr:glycosyltransferase family 4 protein [Candidatus Eremiobacteraceae bacterium]
MLAKKRRTRQTLRVLIGLFPELDAPGGVQRAGRHMAAVLSEFAGSRGMECRLLSLNDSPELHRMTANGREFIFTGCDRGKGRFVAAALKAARRKAKLVLAGHPNLAPVAGLMKFVAPRMKSIICTHGVEVWEPLPRMRRRALQKANVVLAPSQYTADHVRTDQGVQAARMKVLPWPLDPQFEALVTGSAKAGIPEGFPQGRVILTVGRWLGSERYKGMDTLITALPKLLPRWPELQLVAVGEGDDRDWLEDMAEENGVRMHVHFLSGLGYAQLAACYSACEMFALPSRGEGFGLVYLEAMACGKPVIGGAHGGAPEVIEDGKTGYLVQHGDTVQLATSIETLLANPEMGREMGKRGKERVEHEFRFNIFAKSLKKILRELCES